MTELGNEMTILSELLGDVRLRYRKRQIPYASLQQLIDVDKEIRDVLVQPPTDELRIEVRRLTERLHQLDPR
jgi:hypothetical protein